MLATIVFAALTCWNLLISSTNGCTTPSSGLAPQTKGDSTPAPQPSQYEQANSLAPAQMQTSTPSSVAGGCGHSMYWTGGEMSLNISGAGIVGGVPAKQNEYPYQARLLFLKSKSNLCGASIISSTFVMTAAHCCNIISTPKDVLIVVGDHNKSVIDVGEKNLTVVSFTMHSNYDPVSQDYDFCLIQVSPAMTWSLQVQPICLATSCSQECKAVNRKENSDYVFLTGWGATSELNSATAVTPDIIQKARVPVVSTSACANSYSLINQNITDNMLCAGYDSGGIDACQGDSGGPMACAINGYYQLDGVTSFGNGCARKGYYGVYARVCRVKKWIDTIMLAASQQVDAK